MGALMRVDVVEGVGQIAYTKPDAYRHPVTPPHPRLSTPQHTHKGSRVPLLLLIA